MINDQRDMQQAQEARDDMPDEGDSDFSIVPTPITDGSQVLEHDGYDVQAFGEALATYPRLRDAVAVGEAQVVTAPALLRDVWWSVYKRVPQVAPVAPLTSAYELNAQILDQLMSTVEWQNVRDAGTVGDSLASAMATVGLAQRVLGVLDGATIEHINHLHEMESGAAALFAQATALDDLAEQATGDQAAALFADAAQARAAAEAQAAAAAAARAALDEDEDDRADAVRRAARQGFDEAETDITALYHAIDTYAPTGGGGPDGRPLTTKDKLALARQVGQSRRLREIAAICGRFTRIALKVQRSKVHHPPDEVTSITIGRDVARLLPSEIALLTDPQLEDVFFHKFAEGRLMQYELIGNEKQGQGPILVALDSSGSMTESMQDMTKEIWSKAVTLAFMAIARLQGRDMAVLHFSSVGQLRVQHFPKGRAAYTDVIACVNHFYGGGTDFEPWMQEALNLIDQARYDRADAIVISDGLVMIDPHMQAQWNDRRARRGMRSYSVLIGTRDGAGVLASITDALLTLDNLRDDTPVLETIFGV